MGQFSFVLNRSCVCLLGRNSSFERHQIGYWLAAFCVNDDTLFLWYVEKLNWSSLLLSLSFLRLFVKIPGMDPIQFKCHESGILLTTDQGYTGPKWRNIHGFLEGVYHFIDSFCSCSNINAKLNKKEKESHP